MTAEVQWEPIATCPASAFEAYVQRDDGGYRLPFPVVRSRLVIVAASADPDAPTFRQIYFNVDGPEHVRLIVEPTHWRPWAGNRRE